MIILKGNIKRCFMKDSFELSREEKKKLLDIARQTITSYLAGRDKPEFSVDEPNLKARAGAFVSFHAHSGALKGCIGIFESDAPLWKTVIEMAVSAGTRDPRFNPLRSDELKNVDIEISVLSPLRKITNIEEITVGRHGIYITKGFRRGVLLPQVATEYGWDREEFLQHTCMKAGLPSDEWKKGATIEIFSAQVFSEGSMKA
jgi:AmmeMemoRadiSam system protein A